MSTNPLSEISQKGFTIYSKSGCPNCINVKRRIQEQYLLHKIVDCDDYLLEDKEQFLSLMESRIGKPYTTFPMVFYDGKFVGGWRETNHFIENLMLSFEENF